MTIYHLSRPCSDHFHNHPSRLFWLVLFLPSFHLPSANTYVVLSTCTPANRGSGLTESMPHSPAAPFDLAASLPREREAIPMSTWITKTNSFGRMTCMNMGRKDFLEGLLSHKREDALPGSRIPFLHALWGRKAEKKKKEARAAGFFFLFLDK